MQEVQDGVGPFHRMLQMSFLTIVTGFAGFAWVLGQNTAMRGTRATVSMKRTASMLATRSPRAEHLLNVIFSYVQRLI